MAGEAARRGRQELRDSAGKMGKGFLDAVGTNLVQNATWIKIVDRRSVWRRAISSMSSRVWELAGEPGFEPGLTESESVGLPLTYSPRSGSDAIRFGVAAVCCGERGPI